MKPSVARLEYLLGPLVFGVGGTLVSMVGMNIGANQPERALSIAFIGSTAAFVLTATIGVSAAIWPSAWLSLFGSAPDLLQAGRCWASLGATLLACAKKARSDVQANWQDRCIIPLREAFL
jgi:Na+-driven multidrug efflux pump